MSQPYRPTALSTSVVGSHAHPGWLDLAVAATERGELGPRDIREVQDDAVDMALRRVLSEVAHDVRLVTSGTVSERLLRDQEYIEVHLDGSFAPTDLEEVRLSPDDAAAEFAIAERERSGQYTTLVERMWRQRRGEVIQDLVDAKVPVRVVTLHGKGYQWK